MRLKTHLILSKLYRHNYLDLIFVEFFLNKNYNLLFIKSIAYINYFNDRRRRISPFLSQFMKSISLESGRDQIYTRAFIFIVSYACLCGRAFNLERIAKLHSPQPIAERTMIKYENDIQSREQCSISSCGEYQLCV